MLNAHACRQIIMATEWITAMLEPCAPALHRHHTITDLTATGTSKERKWWQIWVLWIKQKYLTVQLVNGLVESSLVRTVNKRVSPLDKNVVGTPSLVLQQTLQRLCGYTAVQIANVHLVRCCSARLRRRAVEKMLSTTKTGQNTNNFSPKPPGTIACCGGTQISVMISGVLISAGVMDCRKNCDLVQVCK